MAQITWQNINAPDLRAPMIGMDAAVRTLNNAFDPMERLVKERQALDEENWDVGVKNNTLKAQSELQQFKDFAAFNKAKEQGQFAPDAFTQKYGAQIDIDKVQPQIKERERSLLDSAYNAAIPLGDVAADAGLDNTLGFKAVEDNLRSQGVPESEIAVRLQAFTESRKPHEALYAKTKAANLETVLQNVPSPKSHAEREKIITDAVKYGQDNNLIIDSNALRARLSQEVQDMSADTAAERETIRFGWAKVNQANTQADRAEQKAQEAASRQADAIAMNVIRSGGTVGDLYKSIEGKADKLPPGKLLSMVSNFTATKANALRLDGAQQRTIDQSNQVGQAAIQSYGESVNQAIIPLQKHISQLSGITPEMISLVEKTDGTVEGLLGTLAANANNKDNWQINNFLKTYKDGSDIKEAIDLQYSHLREKYEPTEAGAILLAAFRQNAQTGNGLAVTSFDKDVTEIANKYGSTKAIRNQVADIIATRDKEIKNMTLDFGSNMNEVITGFERVNLGGNDAEPVLTKAAENLNKQLNDIKTTWDKTISDDSAMGKANRIRADIQASSLKKDIKTNSEKPEKDETTDIPIPLMQGMFLDSQSRNNTDGISELKGLLNAGVDGVGNKAEQIGNLTKTLSKAQQKARNEVLGY